MCMQSTELHAPGWSQGTVACYSSLYGFGHNISNFRQSSCKWKTQTWVLVLVSDFVSLTVEMTFPFSETQHLVVFWCSYQYIWRETTMARGGQQQAKTIIKPIESDKWCRADHPVVMVADWTTTTLLLLHGPEAQLGTVRLKEFLSLMNLYLVCFLLKQRFLARLLTWPNSTIPWNVYV